MATWYDVIDRFIAHPKLKDSFKLQNLFNEEQKQVIAKGRKALTARDLYGDWIDLGQKLDGDKIEALQESNKINKLLATAIVLQCQRRRGLELIENPPTQGRRPKKNVRSADNYRGLPKGLRRQDADRFRRLAKIPKSQWYSHLCDGIDDGSLSLRSAWDLGDEYVQKRNTAKINRIWDKAAKQFEKTHKTAKKRPLAEEKVEWAGDGDWFRLYRSNFQTLHLEKRANHIVSDPPYRRSDLDKKLFRQAQRMGMGQYKTEWKPCLDDRLGLDAGNHPADIDEALGVSLGLHSGIRAGRMAQGDFSSGSVEYQNRFGVQEITPCLNEGQNCRGLHSPCRRTGQEVA